MPGVTLYQGNGISVAWKMINEGRAINAIITDPPYGIGGKWQGGSNPKHGWGKAAQQQRKRNSWDERSPSPDDFCTILSLDVPTIIWGGNYFSSLPVSRGWLVWNKPERGFTLSEAELAWTNLDTVIRVCDCARSDSDREHPTQKPVKLMLWCLHQLKLPKGSVILDPYMGSGTTGVACLLAGYEFIGCELDPEYFTLAKERMKKTKIRAAGTFAGKVFNRHLQDK
jgi:DNA modification methylase